MTPPREDTRATTATPADSRTAALQDVRLGVIHAGSRYTFGFGSGYYGIWDEAAPAGTPLERFPATQEGRQAGWARYQELEPSAQSVDPTAVGFVQHADEERKRSAARPWIVVGVILVAAIVGIVLARRGGGGGGGSGTGAASAGKAHVEITGAVTQTGDLQLKSFQSSGLNSLYPVLKGSWSGTDIQFGLDWNSPTVGETKTNANPHRILTLDVTGQSQITSVRGECTVTFDKVEEGATSGKFTCTGLTFSGLESTVDATGTFEASS